MIFGGRDANGELTDEIMLLNFNNDSIVNIGHLEKPMRINKPYLVY